MSRHRRIAASIWADERFAELSDSAKLLWFRLLTGPEVTNIPGLLVAGRAHMAEAMGWDLAKFDAAFGELSAVPGTVRHTVCHTVSHRYPMAVADWRARVIWLPNGVKRNPPANPKVVMGWRDNWSAVPECALKTEAAKEAVAQLRTLSASLANTFKTLLNQSSEDEHPARLRQAPATHRRDVRPAAETDTVCDTVSDTVGGTVRETLPRARATDPAPDPVLSLSASGSRLFQDHRRDPDLGGPGGASAAPPPLTERPGDLSDQSEPTPATQPAPASAPDVANGTPQRSAATGVRSDDTRQGRPLVPPEQQNAPEGHPGASAADEPASGAYGQPPATKSATPDRQEGASPRQGAEVVPVLRLEPSKPKGRKCRDPSVPRASRITPDWMPSKAAIDYGHSIGVDSAAVVDEFRDWWLSAKDGEKSDWDATFRNRMRELLRRGDAPRWTPPKPPPPPPPPEELEPPVSAAKMAELSAAMLAAMNREQYAPSSLPPECYATADVWMDSSKLVPPDESKMTPEQLKEHLYWKARRAEQLERLREHMRKTGDPFADELGGPTE